MKERYLLAPLLVFRLINSSCNLWIFNEIVCAQPTLDDGATIRSVDKADRYIQCLLQLLAEAITNSREVCQSLCVAHMPLSLVLLLNGNLVLRGCSKGMSGAVKANVCVQLSLQIALHIGSLANEPLHIRLSRAEPNLTKNDIFQLLNIFFARDGDCVGVETCRESLNRQSPETFGVGLNLDRLTVVPTWIYLHGCLWLCPAPDIYCCRVLEHHVVAYNRGQSERLWQFLCHNGCRCQNRNNRKNQKF